jgi:hypothetical protein
MKTMNEIESNEFDNNHGDHYKTCVLSNIDNIKNKRNK